MSTHHLLIAKEYFERACVDLRSRAPFSAGFAVSALQDAVEMAIFAIALRWKVDAEKTFDGQWKAINSKAPPGEPLPYQGKMQALNKVRVSFKHYGVVPDTDEVDRFRANVEAFLEEVGRNVFEVDFATLSEIELLSAEPVKGYLQSASASLETGDIQAALERCADALGAIRSREFPFYGTGWTINYSNVDPVVKKEISLQVGNLRDRVNKVAEVALGALFGLNLVDLQMITSVLPEKQGAEYHWPSPPTFPTQVKNVRRCINVLTRYAIAVDQYWRTGSHPDWDPI